MPAKLGRPHTGDKPALSGPPSRRTLLALVLVVLVAQVVPVVTNKDPGFIGMFDSEQTAIIPATVSYSVNMAQLGPDAIVWNETERRMTINVPPVTIQQPNLQEQQARYYRDGLWVTVFARGPHL